MKCRLNSQQIQALVLHQLEANWAFKSGGGYKPAADISHINIPDMDIASIDRYPMEGASIAMASMDIPSIDMPMHEASIDMPIYKASIDMLSIDTALRRLESCFSCVRSPYYRQGEEAAFKIEHSVQYAIFLYYLSNEIYKKGDEETAGYLYYLNKLMNCVEWFYAVELPEHFCAEHPLGSILGRAEYGDYFFLYQGCTVGGSRKEDRLYYPVIGNHVTMYSDSKILGKCHVGDHVILAANSYVKDMDIPEYSIVFGQYPNVVVKHGMEERIDRLERAVWSDW